MKQDIHQQNYQMLVLIATPRLAEKASEMFSKQNVPIQYKLNAQGTASSEIMDALGFGSIDKNILISMVSSSFSSKMIEMLHSDLRLDSVNSGIVFTVPITGATTLLVRMMQKTNEETNLSNEGKGENTVNAGNHTLIAAIVDRGFSGDVMDAAKSAGAGGGTVLHSRSIADEDDMSFWGFSLREEKEIVLILANHESKKDIMTAISSKCGMNTNAKGLVMSLPIDSVMGI